MSKLPVVREQAKLGAGPSNSVGDSTKIKTAKEFYIDKLRRSEEKVEEELQSLESINRYEAIKKVAEVMEISSFELVTYIDYGEYESERLFNLSHTNH